MLEGLTSHPCSIRSPTVRFTELEPRINVLFCSLRFPSLIQFLIQGKVGYCKSWWLAYWESLEEEKQTRLVGGRLSELEETDHFLGVSWGWYVWIGETGKLSLYLNIIFNVMIIKPIAIPSPCAAERIAQAVYCTHILQSSLLGWEMPSFRPVPWCKNLITSTQFIPFLEQQLPKFPF